MTVIINFCLELDHFFYNCLCCIFRVYGGSRSVNLLSANGCTSDLLSSRKLCLSFKNVGRITAALVSGEGDILSYPKNNTQSSDIEVQPDALGFGTLAAEITPATSSFSVGDDEYDLDRPTEGFASIPEAIEDIRQGKVSGI